MTEAEHPKAGRSDRDAWRLDRVQTSDGRMLPVRDTARRPVWADLPAAVHNAIGRLAGSNVVQANSTGTGFTPGFASRLDLADGRRLFVKAASSADDARHGWQLTDAYREEIRKLRALPAGIPAPQLLWSLDDELASERWVILALDYVDGRPPRRPWRPSELSLVTGVLTELAPMVATAPSEMELGTFLDEFADIDEWMTRVEERDGGSAWLDIVSELARESLVRCQGSAMAHLDLRDDNLLIDGAGRVWICDWNFPLLGAPWLDLVTVLIAAYGDGLDTDALVASHPLTRKVDPRSIDSWLANLWLYFTTAKERPVPDCSPHLRHHQAWYEEAVHDWLESRLAP